MRHAPTINGVGDASKQHRVGEEALGAADELRANSKLKSSEYSMPVLGLVFLKWADFKFAHAQKELEREIKEEGTRRRREIGKVDYQAKGVIYVPDKARFSYLISLPESADVGRAINEAMELIEFENEDLKGVLPKTYQNLESSVLLSLLRIFNSIPMDVEGDAFGNVYEYFLGRFAMAEGQKGGEFFTPVSLVRLIVEILEPSEGRIYDPACGSGGMFVQSAHFVERHQMRPRDRISVYGQEKTSSTVQLCKMNLAVHGLAGDIKEGNTYYEDIHQSLGKFDFVMANPPFNVDRVDKDRVKKDPRFSLGIPTVDNANYLWIEAFYAPLNNRGRAGFVMANSACDSRYSELEIRKKPIDTHCVDVIVSISPNFFYTVTLPCTLWFLDRGKKGTTREKSILMIDARHLYRQADRAHREFTPLQLEFLANIVRMYREQTVENLQQSVDEIHHYFPEGKYADVPGLCRLVALEEVEKHGWSLSPGRYVGTAENDEAETPFFDELSRLRSEAQRLNRTMSRP